MSLHHLSPGEFKTLVQNHNKCINLPSKTVRATFKLSRLLELIAEIVRHPQFKVDDDNTHNICITFVRQNSKHNALGFDSGPKPNQKGKSGGLFTQVVPIITGCVADWNISKFRYLRIDAENPETNVIEKRIPYVRPGGESSGLIPPGFNDDDTFK